MCSESFWFQEASNRHSWKYTRFLGSYQGKGWHLWVACVSIIHSIPGNLKSQKQLVCSSKSLWGTNVAFIKSVLLLAHPPPPLPFLLHLTWKALLSSGFSHKVKVTHSDRVGSSGISALHQTPPTASKTSAPSEEGSLHCPSLMPVIL